MRIADSKNKYEPQILGVDSTDELSTNLQKSKCQVDNFSMLTTFIKSTIIKSTHLPKVDKKLTFVGIDDKV